MTTRTIRRLTLSLAVLATLSFAGSAGAASTAPTSPTNSPAPTPTKTAPSSASVVKELNTTLKDASQRHWVNTDLVLSSQGVTEIAEKLVFGPASATGTINVVTSSGPVLLNITILNAAQQIYVETSPAGLAEFFADLSAAQDTQYANQWLELTPSDPDYSSLSPGASSTTVISSLHLSGHLVAGPPTHVDGQRVIPITGKLSGAKATLYVTDTLRPLPVEIKMSVSGVAATEVFSQWGEGSLPIAPATAIPFPTASTTTTLPTTSTTTTLP